MFTGIIEGLGQVVAIEHEATNTRFTVNWDKANELKVDQSLAHNGVCLTVVEVNPQANTYAVVAIAETLAKTNLNYWKIGNYVNLERCLPIGGRLDGHFVQGHVDTTTHCTQVADRNGSWECHFALPQAFAPLVVPKGSITVNGVSLTVVEAANDSFSVALIPYTWQHTNLHTLATGSVVNLEFDILGKYISRLMNARYTA